MGNFNSTTENSESAKKIESTPSRLVKGSLNLIGAVLLVGLCLMLALAGAMGSGSSNGNDNQLSNIMAFSPILLLAVLIVVVIIRYFARRRK